MRRGTGRVRMVTVSPRSGAGAWLVLMAAFLVGAGAGHLLTGAEELGWTQVLRQVDLTALESTPDWQTLTRLMKLMVLTGLLSFSALGLVGLPLLAGVQGFVSACAVSTMGRTWGLPGLETAAIWIGLGQLPRLTAFLTAAVPGWRVARGIAAGVGNGREDWTGCLRCWAAAWVIGIAGSVICRWLICAMLPRLLWGV